MRTNPSRLPRKGAVPAMAIASLATAMACGFPYRAPLYVSPQIEPTVMSSVAILPVVNATMKSEIDFDVDKTVQRTAGSILKKLKYRMQVVPQADAGQPLTAEELDNPDPSWIRNLAPASSRWVMVVRLEDMTSRLTFGSTGQAEITGWLFDKDQGEVMWRSKGTGSVGQGGLFGMALMGLMERDAVSAATASLLHSFPRKPKR